MLNKIILSASYQSITWKSIFLLIIICSLFSCKDLNEKKEDLICIGITAPEPEEQEPQNNMPNIEDIIPQGYSIVDN